MVDQGKRINFSRERESFVGSRSLTISTLDLAMSFISWCYSRVYFVLYGKRHFAGGIKIMDLKQVDYPGLPKWAQCNHMCPYKGNME